MRLKKVKPQFRLSVSSLTALILFVFSPFPNSAFNQMAHFITSRTRERPGGDESASTELNLGEFQNVPTLTLSEARLLINAVMDHRKQSRQVNETETLIKTQDYLDVFARFKQKENIEAVERMLASKVELEFFERSQLGECA